MQKTHFFNESEEDKKIIPSDETVVEVQILQELVSDTVQNVVSEILQSKDSFETFDDFFEGMIKQQIEAMKKNGIIPEGLDVPVDEIIADLENNYNEYADTETFYDNLATSLEYSKVEMAEDEITNETIAEKFRIMSKLNSYRDTLTHQQIKERVATSLDKNEEEYELFCFSVVCLRNRSLCSLLTKFFDRDPVRFHKISKNSKYYDHFWMYSMSFEDEVKLKQILGVVIASIEDERISKSILNTLKRVIPNTFTAYRLPNKKNVDIFFKKHHAEASKILLNTDLIGGAFVERYLYRNLTLKNDIDGSGREHLDRYNLETLGATENLRHIDFSHSAIDLAEILADVPSSILFIIENISTLSDMNLLILALKMSMKSHEKKFSTKQNYNLSNFFDFCINYVIDDIALVSDVFFVRNLLSLLLKCNLYPDILSLNVGITDSEKEDIIKASFVIKEEQKVFSLTTYFGNFVIFTVAKNYYKVREKICKSNLEEINLDFMISQENEKKLKDELSAKNLEIDRLQRELEKYKSKEFAEKRDISHSEIQLLQPYEKKIQTLSEKLANTQADNYDLAKLRTFVFQNVENTTPNTIESTFDLNEYLENNSVLFVGGIDSHRDKLNRKFPKLRTIDGITSSLNLDFVSSISFVFFYTKYMNHAFYMKIIPILQKNNIPFSFITKTNIPQIEVEIRSVIENL